jgi:hypothetical protein
VPEAIAFRVELLASRRAGGLRTAARLLTLAAAAACALAALLAPSPLRIAATLASVGAVVVAFCPGRAATARRLAIDADGAISAGGDGADGPAAVRYFGRHLVCLETPRGLLAVLPDAMSPSDWRRLLVACRWQHRPSRDGREALSGLRTK